MYIKESENTRCMWYVIDDEDKIIRVFYKKAHATLEIRRLTKLGKEKKSRIK